MSGLFEIWFFVLTGLILTILFLKRPRYALYAILILSPFYFIINNLLTSGALGITTHFSPVDLLMVLGLIGALRKKILRKNNLKEIVSLDIICAGWLLISIFSLLRGVLNGYEAALRSSRGPLLFALYFLSSWELDSGNRLRELANIIFIEAFLSGLIGLVGAMGYLTFLFPALAVGNIGGIFTRPNYFAEPSITIPNILFIIQYLAFMMPRSRGIRLILIIVLGVNIAVLSLSLTRGFWLGMVVAFFAIIFLINKKKSFRRLVKIACLFILGVIVTQIAIQSLSGISLSGELLARFQEAFSGKDPNVIYRLEELRAYYKSFSESPIIGKGFGSPAFSSPDANVGFCHNQYLWILETTGIIGFFLLIGFLIFAVQKGLLCFVRYNWFCYEKIYGILISGTVLGFAVTSFTSPEFTNPTIVPILATLVGLCRTIVDKFNQSKRESSK